MSQRQTPYKIILIGDNCIDEYHYGSVDRISPEAPVPVFVPTHIVTKPGMAANVRENLRNLGFEVVEYLGRPSRKSRLIDQRSKQHLLRIDHDVISDPLLAEHIILDANAIVISDYDKGVVTYELIKEIRGRFLGPIFIDTKKTDLAKFDDCYVKINSLEYREAKTYNNLLIVTHGARGVTFKSNEVEKHYESKHVEVADVCGAGDTFLASFVYKFMYSNNIDESIDFAIRASAVTVQHIGVYAPTLEEIK